MFLQKLESVNWHHNSRHQRAAPVSAARAQKKTADARISRTEFSEAMRSMFAINFGGAILEKLFNYISLDNARSGYITWDNFLG